MIIKANKNFINVNNNFFTNKRKYHLRKIGAGLMVSSAIFILSACGHSPKEDINLGNSISIEDYYSQNFDDELNMKQDDINTINKYYEVLDQYNYSKKNGDEELEKEMRMSLVGISDDIQSIAYQTIKKEINSLTDIDGELTLIDSHDGNLSILISDTLVHQNIPLDKLPKEMSRIITNLDSLSVYKGDGSNNKWDKVMDEYNDKLEELIDDTLTVYYNDYEFNNNEISKIQKTK